MLGQNNLNGSNGNSAASANERINITHEQKIEVIKDRMREFAKEQGITISLYDRTIYDLIIADAMAYIILQAKFDTKLEDWDEAYEALSNESQTELTLEATIATNMTEALGLIEEPSFEDVINQLNINIPEIVAFVREEKMREVYNRLVSENNQTSEQKLIAKGFRQVRISSNDHEAEAPRELGELSEQQPEFKPSEG